jgi:ubiquinone/menaquinone biosynthesis C-methylase UbiE
LRVDEAARITAEYARRAREVPPDRYSLATPAALFARHEQQRVALQALNEAGIDLAKTPTLDVGCGTGAWLETLERFGARDLAGIDLLPDRVELARRRLPDVDVRCGDATRLPWADGSFSLVVVSTMFSSILDPGMTRGVADEIKRVLDDRGSVLWYDFRYRNPGNPNVRGISRREVRELFAGFEGKLRRTTLAPPVARRLVPRSHLAAVVLQATRVPNTHLLGVLTRSPG